MNHFTKTMHEKKVSTAFNRQASLFDALYANDSIIQYKRKRVRDHALSYLHPHSTILELNAGTGEDAIFFARLGHTVHATDISEGMLSELKQKAEASKLQMSISNEQCSFTALDSLSFRGPYDLIFSSFAGLNCTNDLSSVLRSFDNLLKPGGHVTLVVLPKFCLWEFLLLFKGKFKTAFRRFTGKKGSKAHIEGEYFRCWYYHPSYIKKHIGDHFQLLDLEGLCSLVPPSYLQNFDKKYPALYRFLVKKENKLKGKWPWKLIGDYYIITFKKKDRGPAMPI